MSSPIGKAALDQVLARLSASDDGFNATFNAKASDYGLSDVMAIDFAGGAAGRSVNFAMGNFDPAAIESTSPFKYPFVTLFMNRAINQNLQKFQQFAGEVTLGLNVFVQWIPPHVFVDFQSLPGCIEETVFEVFNRARHAVASDQDWGDDVVYNGDLSITRSQVERAAGFWRQLLAFQATFEVIQRGPA